MARKAAGRGDAHGMPAGRPATPPLTSTRSRRPLRLLPHPFPVPRDRYFAFHSQVRPPPVSLSTAAQRHPIPLPPCFVRRAAMLQHYRPRPPRLPGFLRVPWLPLSASNSSNSMPRRPNTPSPSPPRRSAASSRSPPPLPFAGVPSRARRLRPRQAAAVCFLLFFLCHQSNEQRLRVLAKPLLR